MKPNDADLRELDGYVQTQDEVELQAALWVSRGKDGMDEASASRLQAWLAADPAHVEAYRAMEESSQRVSALPEHAIESIRTGLNRRGPPAAMAGAGTARRSRPSLSARLVPRLGWAWPWAATAVATVVLMAGWAGLEHWRSEPVFTGDYVTARGQRLDVELPDGSMLQLDTATRVQVHLYRHRRDAKLLDGQAMFAVSADPTRPFDVAAGAARVTVVGTRFSVRYTHDGLDAGKAIVAVESGQVRVTGVPRQEERKTAAGDRVELHAGQSVTANEAGRLEAIFDLPVQAVGAWRADRVTFGDTPLALALAEFERYADTGLVVRDPAVADLRLGGSFDLRQAGAFAQALPRLLPVRLERRGGTTEIVGLR